jgi:hypothetical protein
LGSAQQQALHEHRGPRTDVHAPSGIRAHNPVDERSKAPPPQAARPQYRLNNLLCLPLVTNLCELQSATLTTECDSVSVELRPPTWLLSAPAPPPFDGNQVIVQQRCNGTDSEKPKELEKIKSNFPVTICSREFPQRITEPQSRDCEQKADTNRLSQLWYRTCDWLLMLDAQWLTGYIVLGLNFGRREGEGGGNRDRNANLMTRRCRRR